MKRLWIALPVFVLLAGSLFAAPPLPFPVNDWGYQLQGYGTSLNQIRNSRFDLIVMDYSRFGDEESEFTGAQVESLRTGSPCGDRIVLAYMSIGEAETYRYYFRPEWIDDGGNPVPGVAPPFLGPFNPDFPDNYKVRFWMPSWKKIIFGVPEGPEKSYLDRIIDAGFDGVYLDIIDAFEFWGPREIGGNDTNRFAARAMIAFVQQIANYARNRRGRPGFLVFPQNGANIIDPAAYPFAVDPAAEAQRQKLRYFRFINGIGAEDTFFYGDLDNNNPLDPQQEIISFLDQFAAAGKPVLAIDYLTNPQKRATFYNMARARGYVPYASTRELNRLRIPSSFPPDCFPRQLPD